MIVQWLLASYRGVSITTPTSFWKLASTTDELWVNTLTNTGSVTFSAGKIGNAADFDTWNKRLWFSTSLWFSSWASMTWGFWVKPTTQVGYLLDIGDSTYARRMILYWDTGSKVSLFVWNNVLTSTSTFSNWTYYFIRVKKSWSTFELFVNESSQGTVSMWAGTTWANFFSIGAAWDWFWANANAQIDAFWYWASTALTTWEWTELYNWWTWREYPF